MLVPKLRFPEFTEEYTPDALVDITDRVRRKNSENQTDIPLTIASIEGLVDQRTYFGKTIASKDMSGYYLLKNGEFAYNKSYSKGYPVGSIKRLDNYEQGALSTLYICFSVKEDADVTSDYLVQYFNSPVWHKTMSEICAEGARNHGLLNVSPDDFFATVHYFAPTEAEQEKISEFLSLYDEKISVQKKKVEALEARKKGLLQKIFSQEIRFKADDGSEFDDWDEVTLGELIEPFTIKTKEENEDILLSCAIDGMFLNTELFDHQRGASNIGYLKVKKGTLILSAQNLHLGNANVNLRFEHGIISPAYKTYNVVGCLPEFMAIWVKREAAKRFFFDATTTGASQCRRNVDWDKLYSQTLLLPSEPEQMKIYDFIKLIDEQIQAEKDKLEALKNVKKGLLQQMFG